MKALFVIDMQEEYVGKDNRYGYDSEDLLTKVNERIEYAQSAKEPIIYVKNRKQLKSGGFIPEFAKGLEVISDNIFYKDKSSLFSNKEIVLFLKENNVKEIEIIGVDGNCCVASSALEGVKFGYKVIFPLRYIGVKNTERFIAKKALLIKSGVNVIE